jgi:hypothetical protein
MDQRASNVKLQVESGDEYKLMELEHQAPIDVELRSRKETKESRI